MNAAGRGPEGPAAATPLQPAPAQPAPPPPPPAFPAAPQAEAPSPVSFAPRVEPQEAIVPAAPPPAAQPSDSRATPLPPGEQPRSSVGATFAIRRRPRVLAYLIEREGEAVGRVHQLEDDVTDLGRDPRNHIVLTDVLISGFHARVERGPDGGFLVHDRKSTNGTFVNEEQLTEMRRLDENDALRLGNTTLVLKLVS